MVQLGVPTNRYYYSFINKRNPYSAWNNFPTLENPNTRYKYTSIKITFSQDQD